MLMPKMTLKGDNGGAKNTHIKLMSLMAIKSMLIAKMTQPGVNSDVKIPDQSKVNWYQKRPAKVC